MTVVSKPGRSSIRTSLKTANSSQLKIPTPCANWAQRRCSSSWSLLYTPKHNSRGHPPLSSLTAIAHSTQSEQSFQEHFSFHGPVLAEHHETHSPPGRAHSEQLEQFFQAHLSSQFIVWPTHHDRHPSSSSASIFS